MNHRQAAIEIARAYLLTHQGQMPLIVVGFNNAGESLALLGNFRKKHELDDQQTFCAILRMAFIANKVTEYHVLAKSRMMLLPDDVDVSAEIESIGDELPEDKAVPVLIVVGVNAGGRAGHIYQLTDGDRNELVSVMEIDTDEGGIEGMFMELLPERSAVLPPDVLKGIEYYVKQIRFVAPEVTLPPAAPEQPTGLNALFTGFNA